MTNNIDLRYPHVPLPKKKGIRFFAVTCLLYAIYTLILLPLSEYVGSNIIFAGTYLYEILTFLCTAVELAAFCWVFAWLISARFTYGNPAAIKVLLLFAGASALRYLAAFFVSWRMEGMSGSDLLFELIFMLIYVLLDVTQAAIILLLTHMLRKRADEVYAVRAEAFAALGESAPDHLAGERANHSFWSMSGSLHIATVLSGVMIAFVRISGRLIYDIGYGAPTDSADLAWMIFSYLSDIALAVLCFSLIRLLCIRLLFPKQQ